ncbi:MAG: hypothetical protein WA939_02190 [Nodosilinea sp.]
MLIESGGRRRAVARRYRNTGQECTREWRVSQGETLGRSNLAYDTDDIEQKIDVYAFASNDALKSIPRFAATTTFPAKLVKQPFPVALRGGPNASQYDPDVDVLRIGWSDAVIAASD